MQRNRWIIIIIVTAAVIAAVVYGFLPKPVSVEIVKVTRGTMTVTVEEEGKTRVKDRYVISSPVPAFMRRINLDVGDIVKKGQVLAELESVRSAALDPRSRAEAEAVVSAREASLKAAQENARAVSADAEYAKSNLQRMIKLYDAGYTSKDALEQAESEAKRADANLLAARAAVKAALFELERSRAALGHTSADGAKNYGKPVSVRSPVEGRVLKIYRESEAAVSPGEPLVDIGDTDKLEVRVEVLSSDAIKIQKGTPVLFERWGDETALTGKVKVVEPAGFTKISSLGVEEQRVLVIADITSLPESWQRLGDGYRVDARFIIWEGKDVLQMPASALFRMSDGWAVFVVRDKKAYLTEVKIGRHNGLVAEIVSGLKEGDMVIAHPDETVKDGVRIKQR